jgi:hypothetical protein
MAQWNKDSQSYLPQHTTLFEVVGLADKDGNIINTFGAASNVPIANGDVQGYSSVHKFGKNPSLGNGNEETIWDGSSLYPWSTWDSGADNVYLKSTTTDTQDVFIQGLNQDWVLTSETITLTGTTAVASQNTYRRLFRMYNANSTDFAGDISAHYGSGTGTVVAKVLIGNNQTLMSVYTVPAGYTAFITDVEFSSPKNAELEMDLYFRPFDNVFRIQQAGSAYGSQYIKKFDIPLKLTEKSDIDLRATAGTGGVVAAASFNFILVDNTYL